MGIATEEKIRTYENDRFELQEYHLSNGLRLLMSVNPFEPRVYTNIAFKAGSKNDPSDLTGLAHYMEHLLFKGTSKIGSLDWHKESVYLEQLADLYETYRAETNENERLRIYREIDRLSGEAAQLAATNEYDKLSTAIGAQQTNAYTSFEQTVYLNDIPANELERWMELESERFTGLALRLFHTELETVFEEFNMIQDNDARKIYRELLAALFPTHPYGTHPVIGKAEHLRNPSMRAIHAFFDRYYTASNMAIVLAGDFDPQQAIALCEKYFGHFPTRDVPSFSAPEQPEIDSIAHRDVWGEESPSVFLAWRLPADQEQLPVMELASAILSNGQAGLMDIHLNQGQLVLGSAAWYWPLRDYGIFGASGKPREGQSLEELEALLLGEIEKIKTGDFEDWLLEAIANEMKSQRFEALESNKGRVGMITGAYVLDLDWDLMSQFSERVSAVSREDVIRFANQYLHKNAYVRVYKHQGSDTTVLKMEKPPITPVTMNRDELSGFAKTFLSKPTPSLEPHFVDFNAVIQTGNLNNGIPIQYVRNPFSPVFRLDIIWEMGSWHLLKLDSADLFFSQIGAGTKQAADVQKTLYRLGLDWKLSVNDESTFLTLSGLEENVVAGMELLMELLQAPHADEEAWQESRADIFKRRQNRKSDKQEILRNALSSYARYGSNSPYKHILPADELHALHASDIVESLKSLLQYPHSIQYYGQKPMKEVVNTLNSLYPMQAPGLTIPESLVFTPVVMDKPRVFVVDFPSVQVDIMQFSNKRAFNHNDFVVSEWYNDYFGYGLSSIVFQEIREAKALAYSAYAYYRSPPKSDRSFSFSTYVGTQPDKIQDALSALQHIVEDMPVSEKQMEQARISIVKRLETDRILPKKWMKKQRENLFLGYDYDVRSDVYQRLAVSSNKDLLAFHQEAIKGSTFHVFVVGEKANMDRAFLENLGEVQELKLEDIFGY